jgi:hypothetical protein
MLLIGRSTMYGGLFARSSERVNVAAHACRHCGTENVVALCREDGRWFVLTTSHLEGRLRGFDDLPIQVVPPGFEPPLCDFCASKARGLPPTETVNAVMRQATCPVCHTEFLSGG